MDAPYYLLKGKAKLGFTKNLILETVARDKKDLRHFKKLRERRWDHFYP